jgi:hypothetical protein
VAYSNTTNQTQITVGQLIEYAFRAAGKTAEEQTPEYINAAKQALYYILMNLSNRGVNLWMLKNLILGAVTDQTVLELPAETIDVREANWRYLVTPQIAEALPLDNHDAPALFTGNLNNHATSTTGENWFGCAYTTAQRIFQVGFNAYVAGGGTATYNLVLEVSNDGVTWTTAETLPTTTLSDKQWAYFPIDPSPAYLFYRIRETVAPTFSLRQVVFSYTQQDIPLARLNRDDYWQLPNKQYSSQRSLQYWFDRGITPSMYLWPIPSNDFQVFQLIIETQIMDVGNLTNQLYLPNRWIAAVQAWLNHELALQLPGVDTGRLTYLQQQYKEWLQQAEWEERDKSPIYLQPNIGYYTR